MANSLTLTNALRRKKQLLFTLTRLRATCTELIRVEFVPSCVVDEKGNDILQVLSVGRRISEGEEVVSREDAE